MFEVGFLGTNAPLYMDMITVYFALLPFLMGLAIFMAIKKRYKLHYIMQLSIYIVSIVFVTIFEIGIRMSGGFNAFIEGSITDYDGMTAFLIVHIVIAIVSVALWSKLIYSATKEYLRNDKKWVTSHKKLGKIIYVGMSITSVMGVSIYYFLFMCAGKIVL